MIHFGSLRIQFSSSCLLLSSYYVQCMINLLQYLQVRLDENPSDKKNKSCQTENEDTNEDEELEIIFSKYPSGLLGFLFGSPAIVTTQHLLRNYIEN